MIDEPQHNELQTLAERAKNYFEEIKSDIYAVQKDNETLIIGLEPKERRYWIGKTESEVIEAQAKDNNKNLIYFIKIPAREGNKLLASFLTV